MGEFKTKIIRRIMLFSGITLITAVMGIYAFFAGTSSEKTSMANGSVSGFQFGLILGIGLLTLRQTIKLSIVVKDEKKLKMLYNEEQDERLKSIRSKAGMPMLMITSVMMLIAAIIAGYFNVVVFYTLIIAAIVQLSIGTIIKLYYMKTM